MTGGAEAVGTGWAGGVVVRRTSTGAGVGAVSVGVDFLAGGAAFWGAGFTIPCFGVSACLGLSKAGVAGAGSAS